VPLLALSTQRELRKLKELLTFNIVRKTYKLTNLQNEERKMDYQPKTQDPDVRHVKQNGHHLTYYKHNNRVIGPVWNRKEDGYSYWMKKPYSDSPGQWWAAPRLFSGAPDFDNAIHVGLGKNQWYDAWEEIRMFLDMAETRMRGAGLNL